MKPRYLLDTSVFCQPIRPQPLVACQQRWQTEGDDRLAVSSISIAELEYGLFLKDSDRLWNAYRAILKDRLTAFDFTAPVASVFGELKSKQTRTGRTVDDFDLAIAATAVAYDLTLATLNERHFQQIDDLRWQNWAES